MVLDISGIMSVLIIAWNLGRDYSTTITKILQKDVMLVGDRIEQRGGNQQLIDNRKLMQVVSPWKAHVIGAPGGGAAVTA